MRDDRVTDGGVQLSGNPVVETWWRLSSDAEDPAINMAVDDAVLEVVARLDSPVFRTYRWDRPAATFGFSQRYSEVAALVSIRPLIRRPTGGGLVLHEVDWTYSLTVPPSHAWYRLSAIDSYRRIHTWLRDAFARMGLDVELAPCCDPRGPGQCFIGAERYDLLFSGRKIAGAAQRRNRHGLLIQGSVQPVPEMIDRDEMESAMMAVANVEWAPLQLDEALNARIAELAADRYAAPAHNQKR